MPTQVPVPKEFSRQFCVKEQRCLQTASCDCLCVETQHPLNQCYQTSLGVIIIVTGVYCLCLSIHDDAPSISQPFLYSLETKIILRRLYDPILQANEHNFHSPPLLIQSPNQQQSIPSQGLDKEPLQEDMPVPHCVRQEQPLGAGQHTHQLAVLCGCNLQGYESCSNKQCQIVIHWSHSNTVNSQFFHRTTFQQYS